MKGLFQMENPVWIFMGKLVDIFVLTMLWFLTSLPIITIGVSTTALYYVTLNLANNEEGYVVRSFFRAFKKNLRQGILAGIFIIAGGVFLGCDIYIYYHMEGSAGTILFWSSLILIAVYSMTVLYLFPLMARCQIDLKHLFAMAFVMAVKNFGWTLFMIVITVCLLFVGIFVMAPLLAVAVGGAVYIHSKILNMLWKEYYPRLIV